MAGWRWMVVAPAFMVGAVMGVLLGVGGAGAEERPAGNGGIEITEWGEIAGRVVGSEPAPEAITGRVYRVVPEPETGRRTEEIAACVGTQFGVRYRLAPPATGEMPVTVEITFPEITMPDGRRMTTSRWNTTAVNTPRYSGWRFDHPYELVAGDWTVAILAGGRRLASRTFRVTVGGPCGAVVS